MLGTSLYDRGKNDKAAVQAIPLTTTPHRFLKQGRLKTVQPLYIQMTDPPDYPNFFWGGTSFSAEQSARPRNDPEDDH